MPRRHSKDAEARAERSASVTMCSWCERIRGPSAEQSGEWTRRESAAEVVRVDHGICADCAARIQGEIA